MTEAVDPRSLDVAAETAAQRFWRVTREEVVNTTLAFFAPFIGGYLVIRRLADPMRAGLGWREKLGL